MRYVAFAGLALIFAGCALNVRAAPWLRLIGGLTMLGASIL